MSASFHTDIKVLLSPGFSTLVFHLASRNKALTHLIFSIYTSTYLILRHSRR